MCVCASWLTGVSKPSMTHMMCAIGSSRGVSEVVGEGVCERRCKPPDEWGVSCTRARQELSRGGSAS